MTLADDLSHGTFYRPLHDPVTGFGGTRYFPLAFALQGGLLRLGAGLLASGFAVSFGAGALLALAVFLLLRRLSLSRALAGGFAALALAGFAGQYALSAVRGDLLPVALSALGLAVMARGRARGTVAAAAAAFSLAFATKPTSLTAAVAAIAWLALCGRRAAAAALGALVAAGATGVVLGTDALSGGRFLTLLRLGIGGAFAGDLLRAPLRLLDQLWFADRSGLVVLLAAVVAAGAGAPRLVRRIRERRPAPLLLAGLWLASALLGCAVVLAFPGTGVNHLVEVEVASAVVLGAAAGGEGRSAGVARVLAPAAALAGLAVALGTWRADASSSRLEEVRAVVRALPTGGPVLSEDPLVPLLAGERPLVVDSWMLHVSAERDPSALVLLAGLLRQRAFPAVVLLEDLARPDAQAWYERGNFGPVVADEIRRGYGCVADFGRYHLYLPRDHHLQSGPDQSGPAAARPAPPPRLDDWWKPGPAL